MMRRRVGLGQAKAMQILNVEEILANDDAAHPLRLHPLAVLDPRREAVTSQPHSAKAAEELTGTCLRFKLPLTIHSRRHSSREPCRSFTTSRETLNPLGNPSQASAPKERRLPVAWREFDFP